MEHHDFDPISFVFGLAFAGLGLLFLIGPIPVGVLAWAFPLLAIGLGLAVAFTARRRPNRVDSRTAAAPESTPPE